VTVMTVNPSLPVNSVKELIAYAKANPGKLNYSSPGVGAVFHMSGRVVQARRWRRHRPRALQGCVAALQGVISGEVAIGFNSLASVLRTCAGKLKVLAVLEAKRYPGCPTSVDRRGDPGSRSRRRGSACSAPPACRLQRFCGCTTSWSLRSGIPKCRAKMTSFAMTVIANTPSNFLRC